MNGIDGLTAGPGTAAETAIEFDVTPGVPLDWDEQIGVAAPTLRRNWITLAQARIPYGVLTFALNRAAGRSVAMVGGVMTEPTGHVRFDPYRILRGGSVADGVAVDGPHPWRDSQPEDIFPCCLLMFPNYETAPVGPGARDPHELADFAAGLVEWCRSQGIRSIAALFVRPDHPAFLTALTDTGFELVPMVQRCDLAVTWPDFDGYLASLPRKRRFAVRRELRDIASAGIVLSERPLAADEPELLRLRSQLVVKYGGTPEPQREVDTLNHFRDVFGRENVLVTEARKAGELLSFSLLIRDGDQWTVPISGSDYDRPETTFTYFATMFYRPVELAPRLGITSIAYGLGTLEAKRLRGCTVSGLFAAALRLSD